MSMVPTMARVSPVVARFLARPVGKLLESTLGAFHFRARMPIPESTSAEAFDRYAAGTKIAASKGPAWRDVQFSGMTLPPVTEAFTLPAVTEPLIAWITSGEAEIQERESEGPWLTNHVKQDSLFLSAAQTRTGSLARRFPPPH